MEMESYQESSTPFLGIHDGTSETVFISSAVALAAVAGKDQRLPGLLPSSPLLSFHYSGSVVLLRSSAAY